MRCSGSVTATPVAGAGAGKAVNAGFEAGFDTSFDTDSGRNIARHHDRIASHDTGDYPCLVSIPGS